MSLCRSAACEHEGSSEQSGLRLAHLFLRFKDGIDKLFVCQFPSIMLLGNVDGNVIFYIIETLVSTLVQICWEGLR